MSWSQVSTNKQVESFLQGYGNPQGVVSAPVNAIYIDLNGPAMYKKGAGSATSGWVAFVQGSIGATAPDAPTSPVATRGNAQASVAFTPGANNGSAITQYEVLSSPGAFSAVGSASPIVVTGLTNGQAYTFTVTATNGIGTSAASAASAAVTPCTVPGAPQNVTAAVASSTTVNVTFDTAANNGNTITTYTVTSSPGGLTGTRSAATGGTVLMTGLTSGVTYTFTVTATNADGVGPAGGPSDPVTPGGAGTNTNRYFGVSSSTSLNAAGIIALGTDTAANHDLTTEINPADEYIYYAFPLRYGLLTSVLLEGNATNQLTAYTGNNGTFTSPDTIVVTPGGGSAENYYVYRSNQLLTSTGLDRTFSSP